MMRAIRPTTILCRQAARVLSTHMKIRTIPLLEDNYSYLIVDEESKTAGVVDPVTPDTISKVIEEEGVRLACILTTHNHWDHAHGNSRMLELYPDIKVYGGRGDAAQAVTDEVDDSSTFKIGTIGVSVLYTPCHTPGHVCYVADPGNGEPKAVFTGDTLFVAGCGNFNAGTPAQMHEALNVKLAGLPHSTLVYCGHEYTEKNLRYALSVEPDNEDIMTKLKWAQQMRAEKMPTIPSTIADELKTNPFMRVTKETVKSYTGLTDPVDVIAEVRKRKTEWGRSN